MAVDGVGLTLTHITGKLKQYFSNQANVMSYESSVMVELMMKHGLWCSDSLTMRSYICCAASYLPLRAFKTIWGDRLISGELKFLDNDNLFSILLRLLGKSSDAVFQWCQSELIKKIGKDELERNLLKAYPDTKMKLETAFGIDYAWRHFFQPDLEHLASTADFPVWSHSGITGMDAWFEKHKNRLTHIFESLKDSPETDTISSCFNQCSPDIRKVLARSAFCLGYDRLLNILVEQDSFLNAAPLSKPLPSTT